MAAIVPRYDKLRAAVGADAWQYLQNYGREYAEGVEESVATGATPDQVYREVLNAVGVLREPLALRCKQAAVYLITQRAT